MSSASLPRPFKVLGLQQIAIGGTSKAKLRELWVDMLGLEVTGNFVSERENVDEDICSMGAGAFKVEVDLMQPVDIAKKPAVHTTPLNTSAYGSTICPLPCHGSLRKACALPPVAFAKARPDLTFVFCIPKPTKSFRLPARVC